MAEQQSTSETVEYRIVMVEPRSRAILGFETQGRYRLPRVIISRSLRSAQQLATAAEIEWGLKVLILDFLSEPGDDAPIAAAIVRSITRASLNLLKLPLEQISEIELPGKERDRLVSILCDATENPLSRICWVDEAVAWVEEVTGKKIASKADAEQLNAGGGFALIRFGMDDGSGCWLKATGEPNQHECTLTALLSDLFPAGLPRLLAIKKEWNAWLTEQAGSPLPAIPTAEALAGAASGFATLQIQTLDFIDDLLAAGAFDQRAFVLRNHIEPVTGYLIDAMERQESTRVPALSRDRILELAKILKRACLSMESLGIPDTLIHNDLNRGNILSDQSRCVFIDWSEASIGNPFLACERLCQVNREHRLEVQSIFRRLWAERIDAASIDQALVLAPLLAIYAYLCGRGNWPRAGDVRLHVDSYARSLARHMDRAAQHPEIEEL
jgi:hypothetical protein